MLSHLCHSYVLFHDFTVKLSFLFSLLSHFPLSELLFCMLRSFDRFAVFEALHIIVNPYTTQDSAVKLILY